MKKTRKTTAKKSPAKAKKSKPVNLTAPDAEVTGQGLAPVRLACAQIHCMTYGGCGIRG